MERIISFPYIGREYTGIIKKSLENLGLNVMLPPKTTDKTIKIGVKNSSDMMCLKGDTNITIDDYTSKKIKDIKINDVVLTHKGGLKKVKRIISRNYNGKILEIDCGGLLKFEITPKHPIFASKKGETSIGFIQSNNLKEGDFIAIPTPREIKNEKVFRWDKKYKSPLKYNFNKLNLSKDILRIIGYYLAEGSIIYNRRKTKQTTGLSFVFSSKEERYIEDICRVIKENVKCSISQRNQKVSVKEILVYSKILADIFLNLCGEYSDKKRLNQKLMNFNPELQLEIVKGFFRGDGHLDKNNHYTCSTTSKDLANQLFWILIKNNIKPSFFKIKRNNKKEVYLLKIFDKSDINKIENFGIKPIRKSKGEYTKKKNCILVPIKKIIEKNFKGKVYNLEIEEDNSYVANFLAVHNCHPYKVTLGNFVEALENGATTLLMYDSFELYGINRKNIFKTFKKLTGKSRFNLLLEFYNLYKNMKKKEERRTWAEDKSNIGIIGEIFSCCDETVNYGLENKIKRYGANPYNTVNLTDFVTRNFFGLNSASEKKYRKQAKGYFNGKLGGHGVENVSNLLKLIDKGIDGIVHILPLTCMPETTVEPIIDYICRNSRTPSLRITIDENISEVNLETRLETFIELIKIKKWKKHT